MHPINIMVNGIPGNMAVLIASHALGDSRFRVIPYSLTGPEISATEHIIGDKTFALIQADDSDTMMADIIQNYTPFIVVDFTHPSAVNSNAEFYCRHRLPFVMGTTGGKREILDETVRHADITAVIAPNMAKQIVGLQAMMAYAAETFPELFSGYQLTVKESHQKGKADTSGTAKAMVAYFNQLGAPFDARDIEMARDPEIQKKQWGIPEAYLSGHGWHTYTLVSDDETVRFEFTHNVNGRDIYASGTLDAVVYLSEKVKAGVKGQVFSMIDVLKNQ
jgi:4-hydroxy-tetrahydrodipicolinate reductase